MGSSDLNSSLAETTPPASPPPSSPSSEATKRGAYKTAKRTGAGETVLVTGGTGFIASHCVEALLEQGFSVRTTVRNPNDQRKCSHLLGLVAQGKPVVLCKADLLSDAGWEEAVKGCTYVIHVATPVVTAVPKDENVIIEPAVQGTLRLMRVAAAAGVKRFVLTSSLGTMVASRKEAVQATKVPVTDDTFAKLPEGKGNKPYFKAKILQERVAWDFIKTPEANGMELAVFCPGAVIGPVLNGNDSESSLGITASFRKQLPAIPDVLLPIIDVRDVAMVHVVGLTHPKAAGERFLLVNELITYKTLMSNVASFYRALGYHVTTRTISYHVARLAALVDPRLQGMLFMFGLNMQFDGSKARRMLDLPPYRKNDDHWYDMGISTIEHGHVPMTKQYKAARQALQVLGGKAGWATYYRPQEEQAATDSQ